MTHDYKRNGTTTLFATLDVATGQVIGQCLPGHRAQEFLTFLETIDRQTPAGLGLHLILDNYATHKAPPIKRWLKRHPRVSLHFTPTSSSWLNLVERLFAEITRQRIRRAALSTACPSSRRPSPHGSTIATLIQSPSSWTAKAGTIIAKYRRARKSLAASIAATNV